MAADEKLNTEPTEPTKKKEVDEQSEGSGKKTLMTLGLVAAIFALLVAFYFWKIGAVDFIYKGY